MGSNYTLPAHASHAPGKFSDAVFLHLIFFAQAQYNMWCNKTGFVSKLPTAVKEVKSKNWLVTDHFSSTWKDPKENMVTYSHDTFRHLAVQWLISADQVRPSL